jgi:hypothetical protein
MKDEVKAELVVRTVGDLKEVHRVGLRSLSHSHVEKVMMGMLRNMSEDYLIDDSEVDEARAREK